MGIYVTVLTLNFWEVNQFLGKVRKEPLDRAQLSR